MADAAAADHVFRLSWATKYPQGKKVYYHPCQDSNSGHLGCNFVKCCQ